MPTPALPFCHLVFKGLRPHPREYPKELNTLGDHIRKRRINLRQKDVARLVGVSKLMVCYWEKNRCQPSTRQIPKNHRVSRIHALQNSIFVGRVAEAMSIKRRIVTRGIG